MIHLIDESRSESWAEVCEEIYAGRRDDLSFYLDQSDKVSSVLELGCSTGRITEFLADLGKDVYAVDPSGIQLEVAKSRTDALQCSGSVTYSHAPLMELAVPLERKFGLAIVPCLAFMSITEAESQQRFLLNVRRCLIPGGRLIIEMEVPDPNVMLADPATLYNHRDICLEDGSSIILYTRRDYEDHMQVGYVKAVAEFLDGAGVLTRKVVHDLDFRYTFRWEMQHLIHMCGFEVLGLYGDFEEGAFNEQSATMVWVAGAH